MNNINLNVIGHVDSPYKEKFAIPRQPGLVTAASGYINLTPEYSDANIVRTLTDFSHIWVVFVFHQTMEQGWKPTVRPPRLGGNEKVGVFATRSTFRPNPIGLSVVQLDDVISQGSQLKLKISGFDLLDETPILDIKPYVPYADAINEAHAGFAQHKPSLERRVVFSEQAIKFCQKQTQLPLLKSLIEQVLAQDPRPAYKHDKPDDKVYGISLYHLNISWHMSSIDQISVIQISEAYEQ